MEANRNMCRYMYFSGADESRSSNPINVLFRQMHMQTWKPK